MNLSLLLNFLKCRDAAKANHLSGYVGFLVPVAGAGAAYALGVLDPYIQAFCADPKEYTIQIIIAIALAATAVNSGTTAVLTPKDNVTIKENNVTTSTGNSDLDRANQDYPPRR